MSNEHTTAILEHINSKKAEHETPNLETVLNAELLAEKPKAVKVNIQNIALGYERMYWLKFEDITIDPSFNPRRQDTDEARDHVISLAESIKTDGIEQPLRVRQTKDGKFVLTDGHCRLLAVQYCYDMLGVEPGLIRIPAMLEPKGMNESDIGMIPLKSNSGKPLTRLELGKQVKRLQKMGLSLQEISKRSGVSKLRLNHALETQELPVEAQDMVARGEVSAAMALEVQEAAQNDEQAVEALKEALAVAKERGNEKALPKDSAMLKAPKEEKKAEAKEAVQRAKGAKAILKEACIIHDTKRRLFAFQLSEEEFADLEIALNVDFQVSRTAEIDY